MSREFDWEKIGRGETEGVGDYLRRLHESGNVCMVASYKKTASIGTLMLDMGSQDHRLNYNERLQPVAVDPTMHYEDGDILLIHRPENDNLHIVGTLFKYQQIEEFSSRGSVWPFRDWVYARRSMDSPT